MNMTPGSPIVSVPCQTGVYPDWICGVTIGEGLGAADGELGSDGGLDGEPTGPGELAFESGSASGVGEACEIIVSGWAGGEGEEEDPQ